MSARTRFILISTAATAALVFGVVAVQTSSAASAPTSGLKQYTDTYKVQHPYNLDQSARFSVTAGPEYNAWIQKGDKPFSKGSGTGPRTEMRWNTNWSEKEHQWEADVLVDKSTEGTCIMQVKGVTGGEAIYINVHNNGNIYNSVTKTALATNMWGKWFHLNSDFDPATGTVRVWINDSLVLTTHYSASASKVWYFKNGVYNTNGSKAEAHFKNIEFWSK